MATISNRKFVTAWMESDTLEQVMRKLSMSASTASSRATKLRSRGVNLPKMSRHGETELNVQELNDIINRYTKK